MADKAHILRLAAALADHDKVTHWAISMRLTRKGDFIDRLTKGGDCRVRTYRRIMDRFGEIWPDDLPWPDDIPRPRKEEAA